MAGRRKKRPAFSVSATNALERAVMSQPEIPTPEVEQPRKSIYDGGPAEQQLPLGEEEQIPAEQPSDSRIDEELRASIEARREERKRNAAEKFKRLDTKVQIGDVGRDVFERAPRTKEKVPQVKIGTRGELVAQRTAQWTNWIVEDFNPLLLRGTQTWCGIPDTWLDNVILSAIDPATNKAITFWDPVLRTRLELSEKKAKTLAKAAAEFSVSPMGVAIVTWVETHQLILTVGAALWVAAQYGWVLMQTKAEVAQVQKIVEQQQLAQLQNQAMAESNGGYATRYPGFGEKTSDYDAEHNQ